MLFYSRIVFCSYSSSTSMPLTYHSLYLQCHLSPEFAFTKTLIILQTHPHVFPQMGLSLSSPQWHSPQPSVVIGGVGFEKTFAYQDLSLLRLSIALLCSFIWHSYCLSSRNDMCTFFPLKCTLRNYFSHLCMPISACFHSSSIKLTSTGLA